MSEETRIIKRVGNYSTSQATTEDCIQCSNAKFGTIIIDGLCLDCLLIPRDERIKELEILLADTAIKLAKVIRENL